MRQLKNTTRSLLIAGGMLTFTFASAQEGRQHMQKDPEARLERMTTELGLTQEQSVRMKAIMDAHAEKRAAIRSMDDPLERQDAMKENAQAQREAMRSVLTPEQQEKAAALREAKREGRGEGKPVREMDPEARAERRTAKLVEELQLSEEQASRIKALLIQHGEKLKSAQAEQDMERRKAMMKDIRRSEMQGVNAVLTPEQQARMKELRHTRSEHKMKMQKERR